jgi:hypothetical protein
MRVNRFIRLIHVNNLYNMAKKSRPRAACRFDTGEARNMTDIEVRTPIWG